MTRDEDIASAMRAIDDVTGEIRRGAAWIGKRDTPLVRLDPFTQEEAERRSVLGRSIVARIDACDRSALPAELRITVSVARHHAATWSHEADWWWVVCDPLRVGFFALFAPTAYGCGFLLQALHVQLRAYAFDGDGDGERYLGLLADYPRLIDQFAARTRGQAQRGIRMPRVQLDQAIELLTRLHAAVPAIVAVAAERRTAIRASDFSERVTRITENEIVPSYERFIGELNSAYREAAPVEVGMKQYPRGAEIYDELVRMHTSTNHSPAAVHAIGMQRMEHIRAEMAGIAHAAGHADTTAFEAAMLADARWRAETPAAIAAVFDRYAARIAPHLAENFDVLPVAGVRAAPLAAELSASMTFGYYEQPSDSEPAGTYFFNAENLAQRALYNVAALTYHELMPGHHLHIATQNENAALSALRRHSFDNAFNEGWAEYAATLAGELGMYAVPEERYGRLMMDAFLTCRLVVDTGMNALGWDLERARDYLHANSGMSTMEIQSETIRYSCDIPAQSLAYKIGETFLMDLRASMRERLGDRFDVRDFHAAVVEPGGLPLHLVAENVARMEPRVRG